MSTEAFIELKGVGVDFPVYNAASQSLKNRLLSSVTGGAIDREHDGVVVVRGLQDINLRISAGERIGLIGHNGAGKTTMLRVLSGIYHPTQGHSTIQGECVSLIDISLGIDPEATGRENIRLRSAMLGFTPEQTRQHMDEIIEFSGLGDFIDMPFRTYSSGMQLRLAFAVSTTVNPQILIMDEWLSTGDENFRERAEQRMRRVVDGTDILILASHSRQLLQTNCDRILWLEHGRVRRDGPAGKVLEEYFGPVATARDESDDAPEAGVAARQEMMRVRRLLESQLGEPRGVVFPVEEQPGNDVARLVSCRLVNPAGEVIGSALTSAAFFLEVEFDVKQGGNFLRAGCIVLDGSGSTLFWTADTDASTTDQPKSTGRWVSRLEIPARLLSPGVLQFSVAISDALVPDRNHAHAVNILPLRIEDDLSDRAARGAYKGPLPGIFRPKLNWFTRQTQTSEQNPSS